MYAASSLAGLAIAPGRVDQDHVNASTCPRLAIIAFGGCLLVSLGFSIAARLLNSQGERWKSLPVVSGFAGTEIFVAGAIMFLCLALGMMANAYWRGTSIMLWAALVPFGYGTGSLGGVLLSRLFRTRDKPHKLTN